MKIYFVRHGQSQWQVARDEDWDSLLTQLGEVQAAHLAAWLKPQPWLDARRRLEIGTLWSSPLQRAQQTAVPLAEALTLPLQTDDDLREADFLVSSRLAQAEHPAAFPPPLRQLDPDYEALKIRANHILQRLVSAAEENGRSVLAVSHGGLISTMLRLATGNDVTSFWIYNTTLSLIEWKRGRWHLVYLNLWDHLPPQLRTY